MSEYKKTFEDEVDWKIIDQLHNATNNFSSSSLEFKKIYFVLLGIFIPIILKIDKFHSTLFIATLCLTIFFWILDIITYYFQESLRNKMDKHFEKLRTRNAIDSDDNEYTLENNRTSKDRFIRSVFNKSSFFYPLILLINVIVVICHYACTC